MATIYSKYRHEVRMDIKKGRLKKLRNAQMLQAATRYKNLFVVVKNILTEFGKNMLNNYKSDKKYLKCLFPFLGKLRTF